MTILGVDTDVLVSWALVGADRHEEARRLLEREVGWRGVRLGLTTQVVYELIHVVTDRRRFANPLAMDAALDLAEGLWTAPETERIAAPAAVVARSTELLRRHGLGRKRILDTALAATLESSGIGRLATWNVRDFERFDFLEVIGSAPE